MLGNAAQLEGGAFGRCCAAFFSIESQKSSALHVHGHVVIEGLQQHETLQGMAEKFESANAKLVDGFLRFKKHVCMQEHARPSMWTEEVRAQVEGEWPDYSERGAAFAAEVLWRGAGFVGLWM